MLWDATSLGLGSGFEPSGLERLGRLPHQQGLCAAACVDESDHHALMYVDLGRAAWANCESPAERRESVKESVRKAREDRDGQVRVRVTPNVCV